MSAERSSKLCSEAQALQSGQEQRRAEPAPYGDHEPEESGKSEWAPSPDQSGTEDATSGARARVRREEVQTPREKKTFSHLTVKQQSQAPGSGITATHQGKKSTSRSLKACSYRDRQRQEEEPRGPGPFYFIGGGNGAEIVSSYCESKGWKRIYSTHRDDFTLKWCQTKSPVNYCNFRAGEQLVYQIPNNKVLTTKIGLLCSLREYERVCCKVKHGQGLRRLKMEEFIPATFRMDVRPEREAFFAQQEGVSISDSHMWICKPTGLNQGKGIFLLKNQEDVVAFKQRLQHMEDGRANGKMYRQPQAFVAQHYVQNPLLLKGKKFDVRSYLLIACTAPYMVFFRHGYVRLTCDLYDPSSNNLSAHLTNQYMQKKNPLYSQLKEDTVWSMESFNAYVNDSFRVAKGLPGDWVMGAFAKRMQQIMTHCFLAVKSKLHCQLGFFDLIGCDFLIDEHFKVWLLEMNCNPALHTNCEVLKEVIPSIVVETLDLTQEIFNKCRLRQKMLPLASQREFVLLYNEVSPPDLTLAQRKSHTDDDLHVKGNKKTQKSDETGLNADSSTQSVRRKNPRPRIQMKLSKCVLLQHAKAADAKHSKTQQTSVFMALSSSAVSDDPSACEKTSEEELRENVLRETKQEV